MRNILIVTAHPDDETLGMGGTMLKHAANGDNLYWLIATSIFEEDGFTAERVASRKREIEEVAKAYGIAKVFTLGYPTMTLSSRTIIEMVPKISQVVNEVKPEVMYTVNRSDAHSDHRILFDAAMACTKSFRYPFIKKVLMYECLSETEFAPALPEKVFIPNYFVDVSEYMDRKLDIMNIYGSELADHPFPRSIDNIKALAHYRGASVGVQYAEAFQLIKFIDK